MSRFTTAVAIAIGAVTVMPAGAQQPPRGRMGMGMMGMGAMPAGQDSARMAMMAVVHELVMNHDRITRTVTNLPNGVRTITESSDSQYVRLIRQHVATTTQGLATTPSPPPPMQTPAMRTILANRDRINTVAEPTANGVQVTQTSSDPAVAAALQAHAAEVTDLVRGGMEALHAAMAARGAGGPPMGRMGRPPRT